MIRVTIIFRNGTTRPFDFMASEDTLESVRDYVMRCMGQVGYGYTGLSYTIKEV